MAVHAAIMAALYAGFLVAGAWLIAVDIREHRLPNAIVLPSIAGLLALQALAAALSGEPSHLLRAMTGALVLAGAYLVLHLVDRNGLGAGDVKLAGLIGLFLGWHGWLVLVVGAAAAFVLGAFWALWLIAARRGTRETHIAFGPFMILGAWSALALA